MTWKKIVDSIFLQSLQYLNYFTLCTSITQASVFYASPEFLMFQFFTISAFERASEWKKNKKGYIDFREISTMNEWNWNQYLIVRLQRCGTAYTIESMVFSIMSDRCAFFSWLDSRFCHRVEAMSSICFSEKPKLIWWKLMIKKWKFVPLSVEFQFWELNRLWNLIILVFLTDWVKSNFREFEARCQQLNISVFSYSLHFLYQIPK